MSKIINVGRVTAYAEAVAGGYTGTIEEWERDLANLGTTAAEVEANRQAVAEDKAAVEENLTTVETYKNSAAQSASEALQSAENAHTDALASTAAKEAAQTAQGIAEEARTDAVSAKGAAERAQTEANASASAATEAALAAGNAAQTASAGADTATQKAAEADASKEAAQEAARTLTIDTTLTQTGQAADAKKVGDEITDLKSASNNMEKTVLIEYSFNPSYQSGWIRPDGTLGNASDACRTGYLNLGNNNIIITPKTGYKIKVAEYNKINDSSTFTRFLVGPDDAPIDARFESISGKYYIVQISAVDGSAVTTSNIPVDAITISYITFTDKTLLIPDKAADAKTVGDKFTELWRDVETIRNEIGYGDISFAVTAGVNHSSGSDVLNVNILAGEKFHVVFSGNVSSPQIYAHYSDGTYSRLITGFTYDGVATKDITGIGVFISGSAIPLDTTVKTVAYTTESIYGKTTLIPDEKTIITTVLGADLPGDISGYGVSSAYAAEMKNAIDAWMGDYAGDTKKVPFIVHTDQHGRLTVARQGIFNLLNWMVNWGGISAIFNLGDTVVDHWENDNTNTNPLLRNATLESARICIKNIPDHKQINVYGNHDTWYSGTLETAVSGVLPSLQYNNPYFTSEGLITKMLDDNSGNKVVYDAKNNVKYLVVAGWDYADKLSGNTGYQWYWINKAHLEWIISQMAENDGYDLVLVSHVPLEMGGVGSVDPITETSIELANPVYITHGTRILLPLWNARKAKTSGSIIYNGETITFDFTACEKDCLCALAGHTHYDGVEYLGGAGLLQVAFDWFANDTIHFGIIDRRNNKVKCWKLSNDNNTPSVDAWEKTFSVS